MRVIAGQYRSRLLLAPPGSATRPTSDRLRETLFSVLGDRVEGATVADLYAGSGAVGIEALSRGAAAVTFAEKAPPAIAAIRKNLTALGLTTQGKMEARPVRRVLEEALERRSAWQLVFLDPPYEAAADYAATLGFLGTHAAVLLRPGALVVAEHASRTPLAERFGHLLRTRVLKQGDAALSFYAVPEPAGPEA